MKKVLLVLDGNDIAPRFDLAMEVAVVCLDGDEKPAQKKDIVLARPSSEALCELVASENVHAVICGGIEKDYIQYLAWKDVSVVHSVMGPAGIALSRFQTGTLNSGDILFEKRKV